MTFAPKHSPKNLSRGEDGKIRILWADGITTELDGDYLRSKCPCATCVEEWTGIVKVSFEDVRGVTVKSMKQVGTYAFLVLFSDGHQTGIFSYRTLREHGRDITA
ncbi:MAG: DUF971 domain-containing protein [Planctomycetota bacterium]